jgi:hypothetical protein
MSDSLPIVYVERSWRASTSSRRSKDMFESGSGASATDAVIQAGQCSNWPTGWTGSRRQGNQTNVSATRARNRHVYRAFSSSRHNGRRSLTQPGLSAESALARLFLFAVSHVVRSSGTSGMPTWSFYLKTSQKGAPDPALLLTRRR